MPNQTCCPEGYYYIDSVGHTNVPYLGSGIVSNSPITTPTFADVINTCGQFRNILFATDPISPIDCPCCPTDYFWDATVNLCRNSLILAKTTASVPCIPCDCVIPPEFVCEPCGTAGLPINLNFDFFKKQCDSCSVDEGITPGGCFVKFVPEQFAVPNILGFRLKLKNYI